MKFIVDSGPHIKSEDNTNKIMLRLLISLMPIVCFAIFKHCVIVFYNTNASIIQALHPVFMILVGILTSYLFEWLYVKFILKKDIKHSFREMSNSYSIIPGLFLALILPVNTPLWIIAFGAFCANIIGKMIFGGIGQNIFNPALIGYLLISASYQSKLGSYLNLYELDGIASATPLTNLSSLNYYGTYENVVAPYGNILNFFTGTIPGAIGEVSKLLIIIAFIYLIITKTIKWKIPTMYILTTFIMTYLIGSIAGLGIWYPLFQVLSGGLLFGAVFMATDPVTSPITSSGQILYGISLGILTVILRFLTPYPEGVMTSILFMNLLVVVFDKIGLKIKDDKRIISFPLIGLITILLCLSFVIGGKLLEQKNDIKVGNKVNSKVEILNKEEKDNKTIYYLSSKGWGIIKATVEVIDGNISSIIVTDSTTETQWNEIEKNNYIDRVINNQKNIDDLDAISGSTKSSDALKNIIKKINELEAANEK